MTDVVVFVNLTKQCNVDCKRCFLYFENRISNNKIEIQTINKFFSSDYLKNKNVTVIWEGGEPTLVGKEYFLKAINEVKKILPNANQTMVTNLFKTPDWVIEISKEHFNSKIETTFALGGKANYAGSEDKYLENFCKNLNKIVSNGISCPVNVELNQETFNYGVKKLLNIIRKTNAKEWEFDVSVDFEKYNKLHIFDDNGYPILPLTISYKDFYSFIDEIFIKNKNVIERLQIKSSFIHQLDRYDENNAFNVMSELSFYTLNPDGSVTTNPLFSDIKNTYIGNIKFQTLDEISNNVKRRRRARSELKRIDYCIKTKCVHFDVCRGGASHVKIIDGSGECAGGKELWDKSVELRK